MVSIPIDFGGYQPAASIHNRAAEFFGRGWDDEGGVVMKSAMAASVSYVFGVGAAVDQE